MNYFSKRSFYFCIFSLVMAVLSLFLPYNETQKIETPTISNILNDSNKYTLLDKDKDSLVAVSALFKDKIDLTVYKHYTELYDQELMGSEDSYLNFTDDNWKSYYTHSFFLLANKLLTEKDVKYITIKSFDPELNYLDMFSEYYDSYKDNHFYSQQFKSFKDTLSFLKNKNEHSETLSILTERYNLWDLNS
jgi:hypothetical protein